MLGDRVREANVFRMRDAASGEIVFFVGTYKNGRYRRAFNALERQKTGCNAELGSLTDVARPYKTLAGAKNAAQNEYGYVLVEDAVYALGNSYTRV